MRPSIALAVTVLIAAPLVPRPAGAAESPTCFGQTATITAADAEPYVDGLAYRIGPEDSVIVGSAGKDYIWARDGGFHIVCALGDDDVVVIEDGMVSGGAGNDILASISGEATIYGDEGDDDIAGRGPGALLYGGPGNDRVVNGEVCDGGPGDDYVRWCTAKPRFWAAHPEARAAAIIRHGQADVEHAEAAEASARINAYPIKPSLPQ